VQRTFGKLLRQRQDEIAEEKVPYLNSPKRIGGASRMPTTPTNIALVIGSGVAAGGVFLLIVSLLGIAKPEPDVPTWLLSWGGLMFIGAGGLFVWRAMQQVRWRARAQRFIEPWRRDYPWPLEFMRDDSARSLRSQLVGLALLILFMVPFNYFGFSGVKSLRDLLQDQRWVPALVAGLFDLAFVILFVFLIYSLVRWWRFGRARFVFEEGPPFYLGGKLLGVFEGNPALSAASNAEAILRGVEEYMVGSGDDTHHVLQALYEDRKPLRINSMGMAHIEFDLPADGPETCLSDVPTRYWELVVRVEKPGVDYEGVFLVPVYRKQQGM
jgi:hypothetical protein